MDLAKALYYTALMMINDHPHHHHAVFNDGDNDHDIEDILPVQ